MKICSSKIRFCCSKNEGVTVKPFIFIIAAVVLWLLSATKTPQKLRNQAPKTWNFQATFLGQTPRFSRFVTGLPDSPPTRPYILVAFPSCFSVKIHPKQKSLQKISRRKFPTEIRPEVATLRFRFSHSANHSRCSRHLTVPNLKNRDFVPGELQN